MLIIKDLLALPRCPCRCHCTGYYTGLDVARRQEAVYHPPRAPLNRQMDEADRDQTHVLRWTPLAGAPHRCFPELARAFVGPKPPNTEIQWHTRSLRRQSCRRNMVPQSSAAGRPRTSGRGPHVCDRSKSVHCPSRRHTASHRGKQRAQNPGLPGRVECHPRVSRRQAIDRA